MSVQTLPEMTAPPVVEVVCGALFAPLEGLDPLALGAYWASRRHAFPDRKLMPAVSETEGFTIGDVPPLRSWMVSEGREYIVQLQNDRFYLNWRASKTQQYPRFQNINGRPGIVTLLAEEFSKFAAFCESETSETPTILTSDLAKINTLYEGEHWNDFGDLKRMMPILSPYDALMSHEMPNFNLRLLDERNWSITTNILSGREAEGDKRRLVRVEIRARGAATNDNFLQVFARLNDRINGLFERLIPREEMIARFGGNS